MRTSRTWYGLLALLITTTICKGNYIIIEGEDFGDYIQGSEFKIMSYDEMKPYGVPVPPGGEGSKAAMVTDEWGQTQTSHFGMEATGDVTFSFIYYCDDLYSELEIRMDYPWEQEYARLCGSTGVDGEQGVWNTGTFVRKCSAASCTGIHVWLYASGRNHGAIVGFQVIEMSADGSTTPTTTITTTTPTTTIILPTITTPTPTTPTTTTPTTTPTTTRTTTTTKPPGLGCYSCGDCPIVDENTEVVYDVAFNTCITSFSGIARNAVVRGGSMDDQPNGKCIQHDTQTDCYCTNEMCNDQPIGHTGDRF